MSLPLQLNDMLVDRTKSSMFLYYLTRATYRHQKRELSHKKIHFAINRLKKISTKNLHGHLDELKYYLQEALSHEREIATKQRREEGVHHSLSKRITHLEENLVRYLSHEESRKKRIKNIEEKLKHKIETKQQTITRLKEQLIKLHALYEKAKKEATPKELAHIKQRLETLKRKLLSAQ